MYIKRLSECDEIVAGDHTLLRELLSPHHDPIEARYSLAVARIGPGLSSSPHALLTTEVYYLIQGKGIMVIDGEEREVGPGDAVYIPPRAVQYLRNTGEEEIVFICIVDPAWRAEDEIVYEE
ncbi:MAG: cupin domain-containing protein [Armatimonadetes bacterium]|nr:cupin domain-containing protein [Armatimonadota bacterium]